MKSLVLLFIFYSSLVAGQDYPRNEIDLSKLADELYATQELDLNYEELYENLVQLLSNPINLNKATDEELRFTKVLSESQIKSLIDYRSTYKNFLSIYELQAVPEFDLQTIHLLAPFVKIADPSAALDASILKRVQKESDNHFIIRYERTLQTKKGFSNMTLPDYAFRGSPDKIYLRFRSSRPGDFSLGFTMEKDAGERIYWLPKQQYYGFDYLSFHVQLQNKGKLKNLVLGDFQSQFGQGLILGGIFGMGKGGETITTVRRSNIGVLPYTSSYEAGYLRGIASTVEVVKNCYVTAFYSNTKRDANLSHDPLGDSVISSFQTTGLHRNEYELSNRKKIGEENWGVVFQYKVAQVDAGLIFNQVTFDKPVLRNPTVYNQFTFEGIQNNNLGFYANYTFQNFTFFSEVSNTITGGAAYTGGILCSLTPKLDMSLLYRKLGRNFYSFYSNAFAESTIPQNESGVYWGWKYRINRKVSVAGYVDLFKFPWLRYRSYSPSHGHEGLLRITYQPSKKVLLFAQAREEVKVRNISGNNSNLFFTTAGKKQNYWISCDYGLSPKLRMKTRAQFSTYNFNHHHSHGFALMQDMSVEVGKFQLVARYVLFDTDDYDNRQYAYENDVLLSYSMPAYYGVGVRKVAMIEYKVNRNIGFWLRYASTRYASDENIGSGMDTITGNIKNDVKFQVRFTF